MNITKEEVVDLKIIRVKEIVDSGTMTLVFSDIQEFLKLAVIDAAFFINSGKDLVQIQEGTILVLENGEKKLKKISTE